MVGIAQKHRGQYKAWNFHLDVERRDFIKQRGLRPAVDVPRFTGGYHDMCLLLKEFSVEHFDLAQGMAGTYEADIFFGIEPLLVYAAFVQGREGADR